MHYTLTRILKNDLKLRPLYISEVRTKKKLQIMSEKREDRGGHDKKKKETILDLSKYLDKKIRVKFSGGREASGVLKGENS